MGFFKKNVNLFLVVILIVSVAALGSASVYYQDVFNNLTTQYSNKSNDLNLCESRLKTQILTLNKTIDSLTTKAADVKKYDELYAEKTEELTSTSEQLSSTSSQLSSTQKQLQDYQQKFADEKARRISSENQVNVLQAENTNLAGQVSTLTSQVNVKNSKINALNDDIDDLESDLAACGG